MSKPLDGKFSYDAEGLFNTVSGQRIPDDEPLFLLRARDYHALEAIAYYLAICARDCNDLHLDATMETIRKFSQFAKEHPERMKQPGITRHVKLEQSR